MNMLTGTLTLFIINTQGATMRTLCGRNDSLWIQDAITTETLLLVFTTSKRDEQVVLALLLA